MLNDGYQTDPATRISIAHTAIACMLTRASRVVNVSETNNGRLAVMPIDTFRMNLMSLSSALQGETNAERLAIDDMGAARIAEILNRAKHDATVTLPVALIEQARQMYGTASLAGKQVEANELHHHEQRLASGQPVDYRLYAAVADAAMVLGELLTRFVKPDQFDGDHDAE